MSEQHTKAALPRLRGGSLFSGIGGLELGLERAELIETIWQCEIDPFCRQVLAKHWPNATRFIDVTQPRDYPDVDLICGGFPCQDLSSGGLRRGIGGSRSSLWWHFAKVVEKVEPEWVVVENVTSGKKQWLPHVRHQLHVLGYRTRALALAASDVGAPHRRRRIFVVAHAHGRNRSPGLVQPLRQGRSHRERAEAGASAASHEADALRGGALQQRGRGEERTQEANAVRRGGGGWREPEPPMVRVVHGVPRGMDGHRRRGCGNAVVPACAEVVGLVIQEMRRAA